MKILVLGGNGFLGNHLINHLSSNKKVDVTSISRVFPSNIINWSPLTILKSMF